MSNSTNQWEGVLLEIVTSTKEGIAKGVDFAMEQAPDVCHQLLAFKMWEHGIWVFVFTFPLLAFLVFLLFMRKRWRALDFDTEAGATAICASILWAFVSLIISGFAIHEAIALIKVVVAPKLYLIEYLSALVK